MTHDSSSYKALKHKEHIRKIPDTYLGSVTLLERKERILSINNKGEWKFKIAKVSCPTGFVKCFHEILTNASDNVRKSKYEGIDPGNIKVKVDKKWVEITNHGLVIPIKKKEHDGKKIYIPEFIFGILLTSTNYEGVRAGAGRNGYGGKIVNIFSLVFEIDIGSPEDGKRYQQKWKDGMNVRCDPKITPYEGKPYVTVRYKLDFEAFQMKEMAKVDIDLLGRYCVDVAYTCGVTVVFNGTKIKVKNITDYAKRLYGPGHKMISFEQEGKVKRQIPKDIKGKDRKNYNNFKAEICVVDYQKGMHCSFVNGIENQNGGTHHEAAIKTFSDVVCSKVNNSAVAKKYSTKITKRDIREKISVIVSVSLINPRFDAQTKTKLEHPNMTFNMPEKFFDKISGWRFYELMTKTLSLKSSNLAKKTDGKKTKYVDVSSFEDANKAGKAESYKCILYVVEGNSASGYIVNGLSSDDRMYTGYYPMRGKPLNASKANDLSYAENRVIGELKAILGLREDVDYTDEKNFRTLRYGKLCITPDADVDGTHIAALVMNIFNEKYKSLIKIGFVQILRTPIIKVFKGAKIINFYSENDFEKWLENNGDKGYTPQYYKGLGSYTEREAKEVFLNPEIATIKHDKNADESFELAFSVKNAKLRKKWISEGLKKNIKIGLEEINASDYIKRELVGYASHSLVRSIPLMIDGFKDVQRKIVCGSKKYWKLDDVDSATKLKFSNPNKEGVEVCIVASYIKAHLKYHHGPRSIENAMKEMTNSYAGSNNMPSFEKKGLFGTRNGTINGVGTDSADGRYAKLLPIAWLKKLYRSEDKPILEKHYVEGKCVGPKFYLPVIPTILVNGTRGVATGWSTYIPCHNPIDVMNWLVTKLKGETPEQIYPYFDGFEGEITIVKRSANKVKKLAEKAEEEEQEEIPKIQDGYELIDLEDLDPAAKIAMRIDGIFEVEKGKNGDDVVVVKEIPIGVGIHNYGKWLEKLAMEKKIKSVDNLSTANKPLFRIKGMERPTLHKLKLRKYYGLSIMTCLDLTGKPVNYQTSTDIMEAFYTLRLQYYYKRKEHMIESMKKKLEFLSNRIRFIRLVAEDKKIEVRNKKKSIIYKEMKDNEIKDVVNVYSSVGVSDLSTDEIEKMMKEKGNLEELVKKTEKMEPKEMWMKDIEELRDAYIKTKERDEKLQIAAEKKKKRKRKK